MKQAGFALFEVLIALVLLTGMIVICDHYLLISLRQAHRNLMQTIKLD